MGRLATHLLEEIPKRYSTLVAGAQTAWDRISVELTNGAGLETALGSDVLPESLVEILTSEIATLVRHAELAAIGQIMDADAVPALGRLLDHTLKVSDITDVVTTNYDRLVEVHAARAGVSVDTMFYGHTLGRLNASRSHDELLRPRTVPGKASAMQLATWPHIRLAKPHGSLDWVSHHDQLLRSELEIPGTKQIIAPGGGKYRLGYEIPFDAHRNRANDAIDGASALLFLGYGFNDEHLQTHLRHKFPQVPVVIVAKELSANAKEYLALSDSAIGIEAGSTDDHCRVIRGSTTVYLDSPLWNLEDLVKEVLGI